MATPFVVPPARITGGFRPSAASAVVWLALASDTDTAWVGGRMAPRSAAREDDPFCPAYGWAYGNAAPPSWIADGIAAVDASLPEAASLLTALSPRDLVLPLDPAAGRIPERPELADAAACILACRMVLACRGGAVPPAFVDRDEAIRSVADASFLASTAGGPDALAAAVRMTSNRNLFARLEDPLTDRIEIEEETA